MHPGEMASIFPHTKSRKLSFACSACHLGKATSSLHAVVTFVGAATMPIWKSHSRIRTNEDVNRMSSNPRCPRFDRNEPKGGLTQLNSKCGVAQGWAMDSTLCKHGCAFRVSTQALSLTEAQGFCACWLCFARLWPEVMPLILNALRPPIEKGSCEC